MVYESTTRVESRVAPGVQLIIRKISFARRLAITRQIRELAERAEFFAAGESAKDKLDAALVGAEIDRIYLLWGLQEIVDLTLDGVAATPESLLATGPEDLVQEVIQAVKAECGLSEDERKN
jgi:hypothetical protein